jgi:excinuclease ABC A subunit
MGKQLGSDLIELLYVFDEPSIGLHPKDISNLIAVLKKLRDQGNSVLVVEHDPAIIRAADYVIDIGPGAGTQGGKIVFQGTVKKLLVDTSSLTGKLLRKKRTITKKVYRRPQGTISIRNATLHNLKNISVNIPTGVFVCVTGVAGAGKSTLINDVFVKEHPEAVVIDQSSIGRSNRSNPATYIGVFNLIRDIFAKSTGKRPSFFSFNSKGSCPKCKGLGFKKIEMHFLGYIKVVCDSCKGKRFSPEVLKLKYRGKNIADILKMSVDDAFVFFDDPEIKAKLAILQKVGLGYLELGQSTDTLSGGEAQRIKITKELGKKGQIYILDEPTTGLHMADIERLLSVLNRLVDTGNTIIVIEHNLDVISNADWIIDLGPEGGERGGKVVATGTPKDIARIKTSYTGKYLAKLFLEQQVKDSD